MAKAPRTPGRQCAVTKAKGDRQCCRQACLSGVSWYSPAASSTPAPNQRLVATIIGDSNAARSSRNCSNVATRLKPVQAVRYPPVNAHVDQPGQSTSACRCTRACSRIMGAAEGTIIATIMIAHITNMAANSVAVQVRSAGSRTAPPTVRAAPPVPIGSMPLASRNR